METAYNWKKSALRQDNPCWPNDLNLGPQNQYTLMDSCTVGPLLCQLSSHFDKTVFILSCRHTGKHNNRLKAYSHTIIQNRLKKLTSVSESAATTFSCWSADPDCSEEICSESSWAAMSSLMSGLLAIQTHQITLLHLPTRQRYSANTLTGRL